MINNSFVTLIRASTISPSIVHLSRPSSRARLQALDAKRTEPGSRCRLAYHHRQTYIQRLRSMKPRLCFVGPHPPCGAAVATATPGALLSRGRSSSSSLAALLFRVPSYALEQAQRWRFDTCVPFPPCGTATAPPADTSASAGAPNASAATPLATGPRSSGTFRRCRPSWACRGVHSACAVAFAAVAVTLGRRWRRCSCDMWG